MVGASSRSAAQSLGRAHVRCVTIDQFGDQDTRQYAKECHIVQTNQQLKERLATYSGHSIACVGQWPGMIEAAQHSDCEIFPSVAAWQTASKLDQLQIAASRADLNVPLATWDRPLGKRSEHFLVKQMVHSGGLGVRWNNPKLSLGGANTIYQEWITGRPFGATFLASEGPASKKNVQLLGICRNLFGRIAEYPFVYRGSFGPVDCIDESNQSKLAIAAESIASESGLLGIFNIDFIQSTDGKISLLEVNPRWSASSEIIERSLTESGCLTPSQSLMGISICAMRGMQTPVLQPSIRNIHSWIKRIIFAKHPLHFNYKQALAATKEMGSLHDLPADGERIEPKSPCCTLIAKVVTGNPSWWAKYRTTVQCIGR